MGYLINDNYRYEWLIYIYIYIEWMGSMNGYRDEAEYHRYWLCMYMYTWYWRFLPHGMETDKMRQWNIMCIYCIYICIHKYIISISKKYWYYMTNWPAEGIYDTKNGIRYWETILGYDWEIYLYLYIYIYTCIEPTIICQLDMMLDLSELRVPLNPP